LTLPVNGEAQEHLVTIQPVLSVELMQPLDDKRYFLPADICSPEQGRSDTSDLTFEIAKQRAAAAVAGDLFQIETLEADGEALRKELIECDVEM